MIRVNDFFDVVLCINLDHRTERWEWMQSQFKKWGVEAIRVQGFPGNEIPQKVQDKSDAPLVYPLKGGSLGSLVGHANAINAAKMMGAESALIFEDDAMLLNNFHSKGECKFLPNVPDNWDMLYLGGKILLDKAIVNPHVCRPSYMYWTVAYGVHSRVYDLCLEVLATRMHWADQLLAGLHPRLNVYTPPTPRVIQHAKNKFPSDNKAPKNKRAREDMR